MSKGIVFKTRSNEKIYPCPYFPVGSIYMSLSSTNPSTYFGGTWVQIKDRFLLGAGSSYTAGNTGGNTTHYHSTANHTLTISEIPSHQHGITSYGGGSQWAVGHLWGRASNESDSVQGDARITQATGGGGAHNHGNTGSSSSMPPYYVVYIWRRTA